MDPLQHGPGQPRDRQSAQGQGNHRDLPHRLGEPRRPRQGHAAGPQPPCLLPSARPWRGSSCCQQDQRQHPREEEADAMRTDRLRCALIEADCDGE